MNLLNHNPSTLLGQLSSFFFFGGYRNSIKRSSLFEILYLGSISLLIIYLIKTGYIDGPKFFYQMLTDPDTIETKRIHDIPPDPSVVESKMTTMRSYYVGGLIVVVICVCIRLFS